MNNGAAYVAVSLSVCVCVWARGAQVRAKSGKLKTIINAMRNETFFYGLAATQKYLLFHFSAGNISSLRTSIRCVPRFLLCFAGQFSGHLSFALKMSNFIQVEKHHIEYALTKRNETKWMENCVYAARSARRWDEINLKVTIEMPSAKR